MSHAAQFELDQYEAAAASFHRLALHKGWVCNVCGETPSRDELDAFTDNGGTCVACQARYERFMRD